MEGECSTTVPTLLLHTLYVIKLEFSDSWGGGGGGGGLKAGKLTLEGRGMDIFWNTFIIGERNTCKAGGPKSSCHFKEVLVTGRNVCMYVTCNGIHSCAVPIRGLEAQVIRGSISA